MRDGDVLVRKLIYHEFIRQKTSRFLFVMWSRARSLSSLCMKGVAPPSPLLPVAWVVIHYDLPARICVSVPLCVCLCTRLLV